MDANPIFATRLSRMNSKEIMGGLAQLAKASRKPAGRSPVDGNS